MLRFPKSMCVLIVVLVAVPVYAHRGGGRGGRSTRAAIENIDVAAVQEELGVTAEQKSKLAEIAAKIQQERSASLQGRGRGGGQSFQDLSDAERAKFFAERAQQRAELVKEIVSTYKPQVATVLDSAQMERLQQIGWQAMGALALQDEDMVKALELSKDAQDKIAAAVSDYNANTPQFGRGGGGASQEERRALRTKRDNAMLAALTDAQKEAYAQLKGKEFDVSVLTQAGQGRGGQGRRGGANNN